MSEPTPSPLRLRSAGVGVVVGGISLAILAVFVPYSLAAGPLTVVALVGGLVGRTKGIWLVQLFLGIGAVGAIGLVEALTTYGIGFGASELAVVAVAFGLVDIVAGTAIHRLQTRSIE